MQFGLRSFFGVMFFLAAILATAGVGPVACVAFGVPAGSIGSLIILRGGCGWLVEGLFGRWAIYPRTIAAGTFTAAVLTLPLGWRPAGVETWMFLAGVNIWHILLASSAAHPRWPSAKLYRFIAPIPMVAVLHAVFCITFGGEEMPLFAPGRNMRYVDCRNDVARAVLWSHLDFRKYGPNHFIIERHLHLGRPNWKERAVIGPGHLLGRDRINTCSPLVRPSLLKILEMLPSDEARSLVMSALADQRNLATVHQGLLLTWQAYARSRSAKEDAAWWDEHKEALSPVYDAHAAAQRVDGWRDLIMRSRRACRSRLSEDAQHEIDLQLRAAESQEIGVWGGDEGFAGAYQLLRMKKGPHIVDGED